MDQNRIAAYFGFAKRAGKLTLGVNAAETLKKSVYLLAADRETQKNSRKIIEKLQAKFSCPLIWFDGLGELVQKSGCRLAAVREENLAKAILNEYHGCGG